MKSVLILAAVLSLATTDGCGKSRKAAKKAPRATVLQALYKEYREGEISECTLKGRKVYTAVLNAYDAGTVIYDAAGKRIATCSYGWGPVEPVCKELEGCNVVYRCRSSISGQPFYDKYGLSK